MVRACKPCDGSFNKCRFCQGSEPNGWWNPIQAIRGADLTGKTYMITGANGGIGFVTARTLLAAGAVVIISTRSTAKTTETIKRLQDELPLSAAPRVKGVSMDLGSLSSIRDGVQEFNELGVKRLDALCLNAGLMAIPDFKETKEGLELVWGVNHVGHFYLFKLLLLTILNTPRHTRIVIVSSEYHCAVPNDFSVNTHLPMKRENYNRSHAYSISKLCNILMAREITKRYGQKGVTAYSLHPGVISSTGLYQNMPRCLPCIFNCCAYIHCSCLWHTDYKSVNKGASTQLFLMTEALENLEPGGYYVGCRLQTHRSPLYRYDIAENYNEAENLWKLTEDIIARSDNSL